MMICLFGFSTPDGQQAAWGAEKPFVFGMLLVGPYNDHGWIQAHYEGGKVLEKEVPGAEMIYIDKVNPADRPGVTTKVSRVWRRNPLNPQYNRRTTGNLLRDDLHAFDPFVVAFDGGE